MQERIQQQFDVISEHTVDLISPEELREKLYYSLQENKPLRLKIGFDPTACDIHLGHTVLLTKLRKIQEFGHVVYLLIGDFTAQIGDPSGRMQLRPMLSPAEIKKNAETYTDQAFKILDPAHTCVVFNSQWYNSLKVSDFISVLSQYTVARLLERDDFALRMQNNKPLSLQELVYPIIQGYDSVELKSDIEFGGTDQKFNLIVGRHLQANFSQAPQVVVTMPLLVGLDGVNKMSKSLNNYVGVTEIPSSMFGKLMSISDQLMWEYFKLLTDKDIQEVKRLHPRDAKLLLASTIVEKYYSKKDAQAAQATFIQTFSQKEIPEDIPEFLCPQELADLIEVLFQAGVVESKNQARRLLKSNAVRCGAEVVTSSTITIPPEGVVLKVGKRRFLRIRCTKEA